MSGALLSRVRKAIVVGSFVFIGEPQNGNDTMGPSLPILETAWPIVPIMPPDNVPLRTICKNTMYTLPANPGDHRYFCFDNIPIQIYGFRLRYDNVSCSGCFCDRAGVKVANKGCGCFNVGYTFRSMVGECNVDVDLPLSDGSNATTHHEVCNFRLLRTTHYFFKDFSEFCRFSDENVDSKTVLLREHIDVMVDHINQNGGWSIVGWFKHGEVTDASGEEKISSDRLPMYISLLVPSEEDYRRLVNEEFNAMRIDGDDS